MLLSNLFTFFELVQVPPLGGGGGLSFLFNFKLLHLTKVKNTTGDMYLLWRLKLMVAQGLFDVQGTVGKMKEFEIKLHAKTEIA